MNFNDLPTTIPILPLPRVILLPRVDIPLNIVEPRYIAMVENALSNARIIGMIQSTGSDHLFSTGCAGRIVSFHETTDGQYLVTLKGVCRFNVEAENTTDIKGFRTITPDWSPYKQDMAEDITNNICRESIMQTLRSYFDKTGLMCDKWEEMYHISCEKLISTISVVCPLDTEEKQALLEAPTLDDRAQLLQAILEKEITQKSQPRSH